MSGCFILGPEETAGADAGAAGSRPLPPAVCTAPAADCDLQPGNGCEVDLSSNPAHCGACEISCSGAGCNDGACGPIPEVILTGQQSPMRLVASADTLYFVTATGADPVENASFGAIVGVGLDGSEPTELASEQLGPDGLAVDDAFVYWTNAVSGTVMRAARDGGSVETIVSGLHAPRDLALGPDSLVWVSGVERVVMRASRDGSQPEVIAQLEAPVLSVAVQGPVFFGTASEVGWIGPAGDAQTLAAGQANVVSVHATAAYVLWAAQGPKATAHGGSIGALPIAGGDAAALASGEESPMTVVADEQYAYWTSLGDGTVKRAPLGGGPVVVMASQQPQPWGAALSGGVLYWTCFGSGEIRRQAVQ